MTTKKDLIIAVLATFSLTVTLFIVIPTRSSGPYDPWVDYNDDGKISLEDITATLDSFGSTGDPTKNVNITNWPTLPEPQTIIVCQNYTLTESDTGRIFANVHVEGYQYASIFVSYKGLSWTEESYLYCFPSCLNIANGTADGIDYSYSRRFTLWQTPFYQNLVSTNFQAGAPYLGFMCVVIGPVNIELTIIVYCYN